MAWIITKKKIKLRLLISIKQFKILYNLFHLLSLEISWKLEISTLFFFKESYKDCYGLNKININITQQAYLPSCTGYMNHDMLRHQ